MSDSQRPSIFESLLARIARKLDEVELPYMVIGGQAVLLYGEPRGVWNDNGGQNLIVSPGTILGVQAKDYVVRKSGIFHLAIENNGSALVRFTSISIWMRALSTCGEELNLGQRP